MDRQITLLEWWGGGIGGFIILAAIAASVEFVSPRAVIQETFPDRPPAAVALTPPPETRRREPPSAESLELGRVLFHREWRPHDPRSHGGDGLGPVFNESSCVACHNQGGAGGAGPANKNVDILSMTPIAALDPATQCVILQNSGRRSGFIADPAKLARFHPGFRTARSAVVYRFGIEFEFANWWQEITSSILESVAGRIGSDSLHANPEPEAGSYLRVRGGPPGRRIETVVGGFVIVSSQRNSTALFGAGLIDGIPDAVIEHAALEKFPDDPEVKGRVSRVHDGRVGKFGWKAQVASLQEFTLAACAIEVGLNVPGHEQAVVPFRPEYQPPGLDLMAEECDALVDFLASLPAPMRAKSEFAKHAAEGERLFAEVGCAACHRPQLGEVEGIYSDLLLHDMGPQLSAVGSYNSTAPRPAEERSDQRRDQSAVTGAQSLEWRTPPLWGVYHSPPYLHDGRAATLEKAIRLHGGEAGDSKQRFNKLSRVERLQLIAFLNSLVAPDAKQMQ